MTDECPTCGSRDKGSFIWTSVHGGCQNWGIKFDPWHKEASPIFKSMAQAESAYRALWADRDVQEIRATAAEKRVLELERALRFTQFCFEGEFGPGYKIFVTGHQMESIRAALDKSEKPF
jgi:hypothetical protein